MKIDIATVKQAHVGFQFDESTHKIVSEKLLAYAKACGESFIVSSMKKCIIVYLINGLFGHEFVFLELFEGIREHELGDGQSRHGCSNKWSVPYTIRIRGKIYRNMLKT